jgi:hypothetical protein
MYSHYVASQVYIPENDIVDVETCQDSNINLKQHQEFVL